MNSLEIRTNDALLFRALELWWEDFSFRLPDGRYILTDLDGFEKLGCDNEYTLSYKKEADLRRPFSLEDLEELLLRKCALTAKRLVAAPDGIFLDGKKLSLTKLEERLLRLLAKAEEPMNGRALSLALWGSERPSNQIGVYIGYLRRKTDTPDGRRLIFTQKGKGYYIQNDK